MHVFICECNKIGNHAVSGPAEFKNLKPKPKPTVCMGLTWDQYPSPIYRQVQVEY